jgi:hypothetical protein
MPYQGSGIRTVPLREIARKGKNPRYLISSARPDYRRTRKHEIFLKTFKPENREVIQLKTSQQNSIVGVISADSE